MGNRSHISSLMLICAGLALSVLGTGCATVQNANPLVVDSQVPRELDKVTLPAYVIEPPDTLVIDAIRLVPLPPYRIEPLDQLVIQSAGVLPTEPIAGLYPVESDGTVNLGPTYGKPKVNRMTTDEAKTAIDEHLKKMGFKEPKTSVALGYSRGMQQVRGEHLVRPDGTVSLGSYGEVRVAGLTLPEAKKAIEQQLWKFLWEPEVSVDVGGYNSKVFYVVLNLAGAGLQIVRLPITGNETVLDALGEINGLPPIASKDRVWLARPAPAGTGCDQVLPVDLRAITECAATATNYQLLPGDRVYVQADPWIAGDNALAKVLAPVERVLGVTLLGSSTIHSVAVRLGSVGSGF
jgi:polysaccharide export outer membrane protein